MDTEVESGNRKGASKLFASVQASARSGAGCAPGGGLENPSAVVSEERQSRLIRNLLGYLKDVPVCGVETQMRYHYTTFGMLGFAMVELTNPPHLKTLRKYPRLCSAYGTPSHRQASRNPNASTL